MKKFEFTGDWEFELQIDAFAGFQSRGGTYTLLDSETESDGLIHVTIHDELNDDPDPLPEQLAAIKYLLNNQQAIAQAILAKVKDEYPALQELYDPNDDLFPPIESTDDVKKVIGIGMAYVLLAHKDGIAYVGYECGCNWDEEHGLGLVLHKDRVIAFGQADEAFSSAKAYADSGIKKPDTEAPLKFYQPHPKYGTRKPSQEASNDWYEFSLIERGMNQEFMALVESGKLSINYRTSSSNMTLLERACQFNNTELTGYILSKNPDTLANAIHNAARRANQEIVELLLKKGASINELNNIDETPLMSVLAVLNSARFHNHLPMDQVQALENTVKWLVTMGADPYTQNKKGRTAFDAFRFQPEPIRKELEQLLKK